MSSPVVDPEPRRWARCTASCGRSRRGCCGSSSPCGSRPPSACSSTRSAAGTCSRPRAGGTCCSAIGGLHARHVPDRAGGRRRGPTCAPAWPTRWPSPCRPRSSRSASPRSPPTPSPGSTSKDARPCSSPPWRCSRSRCRSPSSRCCSCTTSAPTSRSPGSTRRSPCSPTSASTGTTNAVWLSHTAFGMPFAIFLLHNYISSLPRDLFEAARIDGADHFKIFWRLVLPLSVPVLAAFAIFQFLWTWNDYLVASVMIRPNQAAYPTTIVIADLAAGAFGLVGVPAHRRGVHPGRRAPGRLLPAAALLRARHPRRLRQGLSVAPPSVVSKVVVAEPRSVH